MIIPHNRRPSRAALVLLICLLCGERVFCSIGTSNDALSFNTRAPRVVAVGDVHGDLYTFMASLHAAGIVDGSGEWIGKDAILVQTGDIFDRGSDGRLVIAYLQHLAESAKAHGGAVHMLLGNHEVLNLCGMTNYVSKGDCDLFGGCPLRRVAFDGDYGGWLRQRPVALRINDTMFVHAGLEQKWAQKGVKGLNEEARSALNGGPKGCRQAILGDTGPVWSRENVMSGESHHCDELEASLAHISAVEGIPIRRVVVGHTPAFRGAQKGFVRFMCDGKMVVIDILMSRFMGGGHIGALELSPDPHAGTAENSGHWMAALAVPEAQRTPGGRPTPGADALPMSVAEGWKKKLLRGWKEDAFPPMSHLHEEL